MSRLPLAAAAALVLLAGPAAAVDLLPTEVEWGETEARLLVRSRAHAVTVQAEPPVLAAAVAPGGEPDALAPTPRELPARHVWHGLDGIAEVVLRRDSPAREVDITIEDAGSTGVSLTWPAHGRDAPAPTPWIALLASLALLRGRRPRGAVESKAL